MWQNSASIYDKNSCKLDIEGNFLNLVYSMYKKKEKKTSIILNEKLNTFP